MTNLPVGHHWLETNDQMAPRYAMTPNPSFERTAEKLRFSVPSLRSAAAQLKLQGLPHRVQVF